AFASRAERDEPRIIMGRLSLREIWLRLRRHPAGLLGLVGAICFTLLAIIGPWVAPVEPMALNPNALRPPGPGHWLGPDGLASGCLGGVLYGARVSLMVGLLAAAGSVLVGVAVGAAAGYWRGRVEGALMRLTEWVLVIPQFLIVLVVAAIFGADLRLVVVVLALVG